MAREVAEIIPYFLDWKVSNRIAWPDGRARIYQPVMLTQAFDLMMALCCKYEEEQRATAPTQQGA